MQTLTKKLTEGIGTFWLVLGGCGSAVLVAGFPTPDIGFAGVSVEFDLVILTMAYAVGHISSGHFNPAVSLGMWAAGRFPRESYCPVQSCNYSSMSEQRKPCKRGGVHTVRYEIAVESF